MTRRGFISMLAGASGAPFIPWREITKPIIVVPPCRLIVVPHDVSSYCSYIQVEWDNEDTPEVITSIPIAVSWRRDTSGIYRLICTPA